MKKKLSLLEVLKPTKVLVSYLLLDYDNPRLYDGTNQNSDLIDISDPRIQKKIREELDGYDVRELMESIKEIGFNSIERIVAVRYSRMSDYYVVVEGNRRLAAIQNILKEYQQGLSMNPSILESLKELDVLVIDENFFCYDNSNEYQLMIQAIKHLSGVKPWSPIAQAKVLRDLVISKEISVSSAAKSVGMNRNKAAIRMKALYAFENMLNCDEIIKRDITKDVVKYFSYFEEVYADKDLRDYFEWSYESKRYLNTNRIYDLYRWIGITKQPKENVQIRAALEIRLLYKVLTHDEAYKVFIGGSTIKSAYAYILREENEERANASDLIRKALSIIESLPSIFIKKISEEDINVLRKILTLVKEHLGDIYG